jgi:hypothetical protein
MRIKLTRCRRIGSTVAAAAALSAGLLNLNARPLRAQAVPAQADRATSLTPTQLVQAMATHEDNGVSRNDRYEFLSNERSDRTGGHMWTERVAWIAGGNVRLLLAVDGVPLPRAREQQERVRLAALVTDPSAFLQLGQSEKADEARAHQMLDLLPRGFIFENVRLANGIWRMDFRPNPDYSPGGIEERVLQGMSGWLTIDAAQQQMLHIEGRLNQDVSIGFGLLATIHAGSHFSTDRQDIDGRWHTVRVVSDIRGRAIFFKSFSRNTDLTRSDFHYLEPGTTLAEAVALIEQPPISETAASIARPGQSDPR